MLLLMAGLGAFALLRRAGIGRNSGARNLQGADQGRKIHEGGLPSDKRGARLLEASLDAMPEIATEEVGEIEYDSEEGGCLLVQPD